VNDLTGTGSSRWSGPPVPALAGEVVIRSARADRWEGLSHRLAGSAYDKHTEVTERRVLDSITQPNEHTFS